MIFMASQYARELTKARRKWRRRPLGVASIPNILQKVETSRSLPQPKADTTLCWLLTCYGDPGPRSRIRSDPSISNQVTTHTDAGKSHRQVGQHKAVIKPLLERNWVWTQPGVPRAFGHIRKLTRKKGRGMAGKNLGYCKTHTTNQNTKLGKNGSPARSGTWIRKHVAWDESPRRRCHLSASLWQKSRAEPQRYAPDKAPALKHRGQA